jgi:hypothetical protein
MIRKKSSKPDRAWDVIQILTRGARLSLSIPSMAEIASALDVDRQTLWGASFSGSAPLSGVLEHGPDGYRFTEKGLKLMRTMGVRVPNIMTWTTADYDRLTKLVVAYDINIGEIEEALDKYVKEKYGSSPAVQAIPQNKPPDTTERSRPRDGAVLSEARKSKFEDTPGDDAGPVSADGDAEAEAYAHVLRVLEKRKARSRHYDTRAAD